MLDIVILIAAVTLILTSTIYIYQKEPIGYICMGVGLVLVILWGITTYNKPTIIKLKVHGTEYSIASGSAIRIQEDEYKDFRVTLPNGTITLIDRDEVSNIETE